MLTQSSTPALAHYLHVKRDQRHLRCSDARCRRWPSRSAPRATPTYRQSGPPGLPSPAMRMLHSPAFAMLMRAMPVVAQCVA